MDSTSKRAKTEVRDSEGNIGTKLKQLTAFRAGLRTPIALDQTVDAQTIALIKPGTYLLPPKELRGRTPTGIDNVDLTEAGSADEDDVGGQEEEGGSDDGDGYTGDDVINIEGVLVPVKDWLGPHLTRHIRALDKVSPLKVSPEMAMMPHMWQRTGAAKLLYLRDSWVNGGILADEMGLGKTLAAIMCIVESRYEGGGPALVITTKSCSYQWVAELNAACLPEFELRTFLLHDANVPASSLRAYDVVVTTYQFVQRQHAAWIKFVNAMKVAHVSSNFDNVDPKRPTLSIFSDLWTDLDESFKWLVLDESQFIKNTTKPTFRAVSDIPRKGTLLLSGTFLHNQWYDVWSHFALLRGHHIGSLGQFKEVFGSRSYSTGRLKPPTPSRIRRLQKMLMAFVIARPGTLLEKKNRREKDLIFELTISEKQEVDEHMLKYKHAQAASQGEAADFDPNGDDKNVLGHVVRAMQAGQHPGLESRTSTEHPWNIDNVDYDPTADPDYDAWLESVCANGGASNSSRVRFFLDTYRQLVQEFPGEGVIIWSLSTAFLDIVGVALQGIGVNSLKYDGRVSGEKRKDIQEQYKRANGALPLLITSGAGGVGLNMTEASVVIQLEPWWNRNDERQAYARADRQGQTKDVKVVRLLARNSLCDGEMLRVQSRKNRINDKVLSVLLRKDDDPPQIPRGFA